MNSRIIFSTLLLCLFGFSLSAQKGTIRGSLTDAQSGEPIMFANVLVKETGNGNTTDLDGNYSLSLDPGIYSLEFSYIGYSKLEVTDLEVVAGKDTELNAKLTEQSQMLDEIVVTASQIRNTETALLAIQRKAPGLLDGMSSQTFKRTGDSDVGAAIKRVTGVSVENGKHVIVRGLGDRYSKTILNGMDVPGLDPDRNSVQLDIFPTNLVDNIIVYKSFTPDLPGDFSGGMVNIITKDFPSAKTFSASISGSFNPDMHFNNNFITYEGSATDILGFDNGKRANPYTLQTAFPSITRRSEDLTDLTKLLDPTMATMRERSGMNYSGSVAFGDQINLNKVDIGYTVSANYKNETEYYDNFQFNTYVKDPETNVTSLLQDLEGAGELGTNNVLWSTQLGTAIKTENSKISLSALHSQNGTSRAAKINQERKEFGQAVLEKNNLEYTERSVTNFLLAGKHTLNEGKFEINWKLSPTFSHMSEPDIRTTAYEITDGVYELNRSTGGGATRTWRSLDESNYSGTLDLEYTFTGIKKLDAKIKAGFSGVMKERDFEILDYILPVRRRGTIDFTGDPNELFNDELIWSPENDAGVYVEFNYEPAKSYNARQNILSGYVMNELPFSKKFKLIYGARIEKVDNWYTGRRQNIVDVESDFFQDRKVLDELDILPAFNAVYTLAEDLEKGTTMNFRASASQTLARPTFKEKSIAQIEDRITGRTFIGNIDLEETHITNADLRWEYFLPEGQIVSVSGFYKSFEKPIELTAFDATSPNNFIPRNVGDATVVGLEFELRKNLSFIAPSLKQFSLNVNTTLVQSNVQMTTEEFTGRQITARDGELIEDTRRMVGQSPYLINAGLSYNDREKGWETNLSFNTQGERLSIVGIGQVPDVYEKPFDSLNFKLSKSFNDHWKASFSMNNILGSEKQKVYQSFNTADQLFELYQPGQTFSFSLNYRL